MAQGSHENNKPFIGRHGIIGSKALLGQQIIKAWSQTKHQRNSSIMTTTSKPHCNYKHHHNSSKKYHWKQRQHRGNKRCCMSKNRNQASSQTSIVATSIVATARKVLIGKKQLSLRCYKYYHQKRHCWNQTSIVATTIVGNKHRGNNRKQHCRQQEWFCSNKRTSQMSRQLNFFLLSVASNCASGRHCRFCTFVSASTLIT